MTNLTTTYVRCQKYQTSQFAACPAAGVTCAANEQCSYDLTDRKLKCACPSATVRDARGYCVASAGWNRMLQCHNVTVLQCYNLTVVQCHSVTMSHCHIVTMPQCYNVTMSQSYDVACNATMSCYDVAMLQCSNVTLTMSQYSNVTMSQFQFQYVELRNSLALTS